MSRRFRIIRRVNEGTIWAGVPMRAPYGLEIIENCVTCPHREERIFCNLSPEAVQELSTITSASAYPKGATLFMEGQAVRGVFIVCNGSVKLSTSSADGKTLIVRIADPGEVLGLAATVTGKQYELTADVIEPAQANFIARGDFLAFLEKYGEVALRVAQQMGEIYHAAVAEMRSIGLSHSAGEKLARFLLDWCAGHAQTKDEPRATLTMTHEEIAQIIGASRETVTRLFTDFKKKRYLNVEGSALIIRNKSALERLAGTAV
jgi:CRP/FNR family transcriptional regulator, cyclic AMP receptor protein